MTTHLKGQGPDPQRAVHRPPHQVRRYDSDDLQQGQSVETILTPTVGSTPESASMMVTSGLDPTSPHNINLTGTGH